MKTFLADLHIHSVLSPCGDLEMSPVNIVEAAKKRNLDILGITDHNSTLHCQLTKEIGAELGIFVLTGAEVNTKEEVHVLTFFENEESLKAFQEYLDMHLTPVKNNPDKFGYQVMVDRAENIIGYKDELLISSINQDVYEVERMVHKLNGIFIPAHIDRPYNSIISQLGFIPDDLNIDALEVSRYAGADFIAQIKNRLPGVSIITSSDAHYIEDIGKVSTKMQLQTLCFSDIRLSLNPEKATSNSLK